MGGIGLFCGQQQGTPTKNTGRVILGLFLKRAICYHTQRGEGL